MVVHFNLSLIMWPMFINILSNAWVDHKLHYKAYNLSKQNEFNVYFIFSRPLSVEKFKSYSYFNYDN